jgi:hypothetical protein
MSTSNTPGSMSQRSAAMEPQRDREGTLTHVIETLLDKGLVINADIMVSVAGVELLGIRIRAALASFDTAARYGLEFPAGTNQDTVAWQDSLEQKETCPQCGKRAPVRQLLSEFCPWCGWRSAQALEQDGQSSRDRSPVEAQSGADHGQLSGPDAGAATAGTGSDREQ